MNGEPRKQVLEQLDALKREIAEYHRWLAEFPDVCRVLENLMLRIERPLPGTEQARYRSILGLRDELRAMRTVGGTLDTRCGYRLPVGVGPSVAVPINATTTWRTGSAGFLVRVCEATDAECSRGCNVMPCAQRSGAAGGGEGRKP